MQISSSERIRGTHTHTHKHTISRSQKPSWRATRDCAPSNNWVRLRTDAVNATVVEVLYADRNFGNLSVLYRSQSSIKCFDIRVGISGKQLYTLRKAMISGSPRHLDKKKYKYVYKLEILSFNTDVIIFVVLPEHRINILMQQRQYQLWYHLMM